MSQTSKTILYFDAGVPEKAARYYISKEAGKRPVIAICANYVLESALSAKPPKGSAVIFSSVLTRPEYDQFHWNHARIISRATTNHLKRAFRAGKYMDALSFLDAFEERLADNVHRYIRPVCHLMRIISENTPGKIVIVSGPNRAAERLADDLQRHTGIKASWETGRPYHTIPLETWRALVGGLTGTAKPAFVKEERRGPPPFSLKTQPDILFVTLARDPLYRSSIVNVASSLLDENTVEMLGVNSKPGDRDEHASAFTAAGLPISFSAAESLQPPSEQAVAILKRCIPTIPNIMKTHGRACPEPLRNYAMSFFMPTIPSVFGYIETLSRRMNDEIKGVKCVVVSPGRLLESRLAVMAAKRQGIPSVDIQLGTLNGAPKFLSPIADKILAQDALSKDYLIEHFGRSSSDIELIGTPKTDDLIRDYSETDRRSARREIGILHNDPIFMFASQPFAMDLMAPVVEMFISICGKVRGRGIVVVHPRETEERIDHYRSLVEKAGLSQKVEVVENANVYEYVLSSNLVAMYCSGLGMEAFALKRPVITLNPFKTDLPVDLQSAGIAKAITSISAGASLFRRISQSEDFDLRSELPAECRDMYDENMAVSDGNAVKRAKNFVRGMMQVRLLEKVSSRGPKPGLWSNIPKFWTGRA